MEQELLKVIKTYFGDVPLRAITALAIAQFQKLRKEPPIDKLAANGTPVSQGATFTSPLTGAVMKSHASNRTINMNVAALGRVLKYVGSWAAIEKQVERLGLDPFPLTE